jgi:hypothetical protein
VHFIGTAGGSVVGQDAPIHRVLPAGKLPDDARLKPLRTLNDAYHPWSPPMSLPEWERESVRIRTQLQVAMGLWPAPARSPIQTTIHGRLERDDYTIDKVFLPTLPGFYLTGSLYKPKTINGKRPGILCPHGHSQDGRMNDAGEAGAKRELDTNAESIPNAARYFLQAKCVQLARMGCIVFHYDMVGYADSRQLEHGNAFTGLVPAQYQANLMGLQTLNSLQALDFIASLPDVDPERIGVTGQSGGGTQTFILCALDPRPAAAFPAAMVGTAMQGGCICENANYLRTGINNIAITALFAPRPIAFSACDDWTIDIETKGMPEFRQIWSLYGKSDLLAVKTWPQFPHNFNLPAREMMYAWFNRHLNLGLDEPIRERDFIPVPPAELTVFTPEHPRPTDALDAAGVEAAMIAAAKSDYATLLASAATDAAEYRRVVGGAAQVILDTGVPSSMEISTVAPLQQVNANNTHMVKGSFSRRNANEEIPTLALIPNDFRGEVVVWIDIAGKRHLFGADGKPTPAVQKLLDARYGVVSADVFQTGEYLADGQPVPTPRVNERFSGYTYGYNQPWVSQRVRDILTVVGIARRQANITKVHLAGRGDAAPWVLLANALAGNAVDRCCVDIAGFGFSKVTDQASPQFLPGALRYGGLGGLAALSAPRELTIVGAEATPADELAPLHTLYGPTPAALKLTPASPSVEEFAGLLVQ